MPATPKRAPRCSPAYGRCGACTTPLQAWGPRDAGAVILSAEFGCAMCQAPRVQIHAPVCRCVDCRDGIDSVHKISS